MPKTLVLGIGNLLRKDDGFGIHVIERLGRAKLPADVGLLDGGTAGIDLATYLEGVERLIIADAVLEDGPPGRVRIINAGELTARDYFISGHFGSLGDLLDLAGAISKRPKAVVVCAIPEDCDSYASGLSLPLRAAVQEAAGLITEMIEGKMEWVWS